MRLPYLEVLGTMTRGDVDDAGVLTRHRLR